MQHAADAPCRSMRWPELASSAHGHGAVAHQARRPRAGLADWQIKRVTRHLEANVTEHVSRAALAAMVRLSISHFGRCFRASTGKTPHAYLTTCRMERAKRLMRETAIPLSQVALECGMADQSHFSRVFSAVEGISPGAWRRRAKAGQALASPLPARAAGAGAGEAALASATI